ncbi:3,7-dideoxy-D-threo-hepto-2, 6-diulosonate synthase [Pseudomonas chlororaphis subsp. aureofaciens]|uniref:3-dehydroquinate synthase II n=1 Tax=Pseudomonas chlororaphis TaxID=587753 RepID=UPI000F6FF6B8|nr:3-dehydroquinate synthase II [Pseudomonas chlororaphis]AZD84288.1 3,7-dideoxy-D-threo-hepto-2, 6-diulosonate synthase [Pseudomonas chlororaphis subsp. aureofaciens]
MTTQQPVVRKPETSPVKPQQSHAEATEFATPETVAARAAVQLTNIIGTGNKREAISGPVVWFDTVQLKEQTPSDGIFARIINSTYTGLVVYLDNIDSLLPAMPERMLVILKLNSHKEIKAFREHAVFAKFKNGSKRFVVAFNDAVELAKLQKDKVSVCYETYVDDNNKLLDSISTGLAFDYLWILFRDPTNIPLELVIASLQSTNTVLLKEIRDPEAVDDAIVTYGVMEYGAEGVIFSPRRQEDLGRFLEKLEQKSHSPLNLSVGTIRKCEPVGMGYRACIDTATLFDDDEGMLVGSSSQGGILCCPEVYFLPYMELRPFRVNAGAVHSYVFNVNDRTDYMSELKSGSPIMIVNSKGRVRSAPVGRMKIEQRPLRLIEVVFSEGEVVSVLMQDDWHVRIFSDKAKPLNISELKHGDKVLGYVTESGRHVGIKINESIIEK